MRSTYFLLSVFFCVASLTSATAVEQHTFKLEQDPNQDTCSEPVLQKDKNELVALIKDTAVVPQEGPTLSKALVPPAGKPLHRQLGDSITVTVTVTVSGCVLGVCGSVSVSVSVTINMKRRALRLGSAESKAALSADYEEHVTKDVMQKVDAWVAAHKGDPCLSKGESFELTVTL